MANLREIDGLPIVDAAEPLTLYIEDCDIENATPQDPSDCVAARALLRQHHAEEVRVHASRVYVRWNTAEWLRYQTPAILRDEELAFDRGGTAFQGPARIITLPVLRPSARVYGQRQGSNSSKRTGTMRRPRRVITNVRPHA